MASLIPESVMHLQATVFVNPIEVYQLGHKNIILAEAKQMVAQVVHKLLNECVEIKDNGFGQTLNLDVYVFSPADLQKLILQARQEGAQDTMRWSNETVLENLKIQLDR